MACDAAGMCVPVCDVPAPETCNGFDDDCDGQVDEETAGALLCPNGGMCANGQCVGVLVCMSDADCPPGQVCDPATAMCTTPGMCVPAPEQCNGIDDDCDGVVDDAVPGTTLCPNGTQCVNGSCGGMMMCSANVQCPAGQVCMNGICQ
jgi:Cys-rich repeat protein